MDDIDFNSPFFCLFHHAVYFFLGHIGALGHPKAKRPFRDHRDFPGLADIGPQQSLVIFFHPDIIVQYPVICLHIIGNTRKTAHRKTGTGISIQKNGISPAAHKKRVVFIRFFRIGTQRITLPAVNGLSPFPKIGELLSKPVKLLIRIQIHRFMNRGNLLLFIVGKAYRQIFTHIVHVRIINLFPGFQLPIQIIADLPGILPDPDLYPASGQHYVRIVF